MIVTLYTYIVLLAISVHYASSYSFANQGVNWMTMSWNGAKFSQRLFKSVLIGSVFSASVFNAQPSLLMNRHHGHSYHSHMVHALDRKSVFEGEYNDPNHPGCLRKITVVGNKVTITGSDDIDSKSIWIINAVESTPGKILVDFSPKGGPKDLLGIYSATNNRIEWPDGNTWTKKDDYN